MITWLFVWACTGPPEPPPAPPPPDPCDEAWVELSTLAAAIEGAKAPDEPAFRSACTAMPTASRDCLSPRRHAIEPARCHKALEALTAEQRAAVSSALDAGARLP